MPSRSSSNVTVLRYPRPQRPQRRARRWLWPIVLALVAAAIYFCLRKPPLPPPPAPPPRPRFGIIAGHWQSDSGAVCPDGLQEVHITLAVAREVVARLQELGYDAEMLAEYDESLNGYQATALVSLHADSCEYALSGYKCVGSSRGPAAGDSALLAQVLSSRYAAASGLAFHADTITPAMTHYHAFGQVDPYTPAVILELGFMSNDRSFLVGQPERAAHGIVDGLVTFLNAKAERDATPTPSR